MRESLAIEQIDLRTVGPYRVSASLALPILFSIIDNPFNSLKHLTLPNNWESELQSNNPSLDRFIRRYNGMMDYRKFNCAGCNGSENCHESDADHTWIEWNDNTFWPQGFTCYKCLRNWCEDSEKGIFYCNKCNKGHCGECVPGTSCTICKETDLCSRCVGEQKTTECEECEGSCCINHQEVIKCDNCSRRRCNDCALNYSCKYCNKKLCGNCGGNIVMVYCESCKNDVCHTCIEARGRDSTYDCNECYLLAHSHLNSMEAINVDRHLFDDD